MVDSIYSPSDSLIVGSVLYNVWVNGVPYKGPRILDAELMMEYGAHDLFLLRIEYPRSYSPNSFNIWPDDTPIAIQWGRMPDVSVWYGYVNHHELTANADSGTHAQQITYACIGTSRVLNHDKTRNWENVSPTYIARKIAQENGFRAVTSPTGWVLGHESQVGESDFVFLNYIANKAGLKFWCSGGTLYMIAPDIALQGNTNAAPPTFYANKSYKTQDTVRNFEVLRGQNIPGSVVAQRALFGIDTNTGMPFSAVNKPITNLGTDKTIIKTDAAVTNYYDAKNRIDAYARLSQFFNAATAQLFGNTSVYPGKLVNIAGVALSDNMEGCWLVFKTIHKLLVSGTSNPTQDKYLVDVEMVRNSDTQLSLDNFAIVQPEFVQMRMNQNTNLWFSSDQSVISINTTTSGSTTP